MNEYGPMCEPHKLALDNNYTKQVNNINTPMNKYGPMYVPPHVHIINLKNSHEMRVYCRNNITTCKKMIKHQVQVPNAVPHPITYRQQKGILKYNTNEIGKIKKQVSFSNKIYYNNFKMPRDDISGRRVIVNDAQLNKK